MSPNRRPLIVPAGTQVVTRVEVARQGTKRPAGCVGVIVGSPADATHAYRISFVDGGVASLRRTEFGILKHVKGAGFVSVADPRDDFDFFAAHVIHRCVVGSRAYGLESEESDTDRRGIYLPPADLHWSLYGVPSQIEREATQECHWELGNFLVMALKANPNILEVLWSPLVEATTPLGQELIALREAFLSRLVFQTYNGYTLSQFRKIEQDLRARCAIKWKHAMHLIRLLLSGIGVLRDGAVQVRVLDHRERLLLIRRGQMPWDEVDAWRLDLHRQFEEAFKATKLPERPDYDRVNAFLVRARRSALWGERRRRDMRRSSLQRQRPWLLRKGERESVRAEATPRGAGATS